LEGKNTDDLDFAPYGVLLIGMIDETLGNHFVFVTAGITHELNEGDTIVCIGTKEKLDAFEEEIKKKESSI
jgi:voltage-gated potassium channel